MQFSKRQIHAGNPLANALVVVVGALVIGASLVLGVVAMVILGSIVLVLASIIGIRVWWLRRRMERQFGAAKRNEHSGESAVIEGEYRVITQRGGQDDRHKN